MATVTIPNRPAGSDVRSIAQILADFDAVTAFLNGANLDTSNLSAAAKESLVPVGTVLTTARSSAPAGYLMCDGAAVSRTTYADLFTAIGTAYGVGDGSTTFNLPDLRGRAPVGVDGAAGRLDANDALGNSGGEQKHTLVVAELPSHNHSGSTATIFQEPQDGSAHGHTTAGAVGFAGPPTTGGGGGTNRTVPLGISGQGSGTPHNVMQPYQVLNYMIKI